MPEQSTEIRGKVVLHRHGFVSDERIIEMIVATADSAHYGDETDEATDYVLAVGGNAPVARRIFPDAAIHTDPAVFRELARDEICLLAFKGADGAVVAFYGLSYVRASQFGSLWRVCYKREAATAAA